MKRIFILMLICLMAYIVGYSTTTTTTNLSLVKIASGDETVDWFDNANANLDIIDAIFNTVSLTEFGYLDNVTSNIQTQLNAKQTYDATLLSIAALGTAADKIAYSTGVDTWAETALTAFGRSIIDDANEATFKATVNLEIGTDVQAYSADNAFRTDKLSVFAATTSAELAGVISNETGSGLLVYGTSPNITTPTGIVKGDVGLSNIENLKVKLDATTAPTVNNDVDEGYSVGSRWFDITNDEEYVCLDATDGAAVWQKSAPGGGSGSVDTSGTPVANDIARFTDADTIEGLSYAEFKVALDLEIGTDLQAYDAQLADIAALAVTDSNFIVGDGTNWVAESGATARTSLGIDLSLYYLKTAIDTLGEVETIYSANIIDSTELGTALSDYYLKTAIDTLSEMETIWGLNVTTSTEMATALTDYYLKTAIDTQGEMETIWGVSLANDSELHTQNTDTALGVQTANIVFEGSSADEYETTLAITNPTADRIITFPDSDQTVGVATSITDGIIVKDDLTASTDFGNISTDASKNLILDANSVDSANYVDASIDHEHLAPDVISGLDDVTSADDDYMMIWDATDSLLKKVDMGEVRGAGGGTVDTSGTPVALDFAKFTDADTIEGRSYSETRNDLQNYIIYPQDYATGTGTSGDPWAGDCIDDAIAAASAGDTIFLRAGYYALTGACSVSKSLNIIGEGINKTFIITDNTYGFDINSVDYVTLKGFTVDGDAATPATQFLSPIIFNNCDYGTIEDVAAINGAWYGIGLYECNHMLLHNVYLGDNYDVALHPSSDTAGRNMYNTYRDIYIWGTGTCGLGDRGNGEAGKPIEDCHNIYDNIRVWGTGDHGIQICYQKGAVLSNSFASDNGCWGISLIGVEDVSINNCVLTLNGYGDSEAALSITDSKNVNLTNVIVKNNYNGTVITDCSNINFASCQVYDERKTTGTDIAFVDGGAGVDTITQASAVFLTEGFVAGKSITVTGSTSNNVTKTIVSVTANTITLAAGSLVEEAAGDAVTITHAVDQSWGLQLNNGTNTNINLINCRLSPNEGGEILTPSNGGRFSLINDDIDLIFGTDSNWKVQYDEDVDNQLLWITAGTASIAVTDPMFEIIVGATPTADQQVFGIAKGTQVSNTPLFTIDEDGDVLIAGTLGVTGAITGYEPELTDEASLYSTLSDVDLFLEDLVDDTTPTLGGNLDASDKNITGIGRASFTQELDNGTKEANFSVDFATDQKQKATLTANAMTLTLDTTSVGVGNYLLKIVNGGLATLTWASESGAILWVGGVTPTLTASGTDIVTFYFDGTNWFGVASLAFATP